MTEKRADDNPTMRPYLRQRIRDALKEAGLHIPSHAILDALEEVVIDELQTLRERCALIVEQGGSFCDDGMDKEQIERLAVVLLTHYCDPTGAILLPEGE